MSLHTLWLLALGIAVLAVVLVAGLLVARVARDRLTEHRDRQRTAIAAALMGVAFDPNSKALARYARQELLVAEAAQSMADLVRGPHLERIEEALARYGLRARLIRRLAKGRKRQRMVAAEALALLPGDDTVDALYQALGDRWPEVRLAALFSLLDLNQSPTIPQILEVMGSGEWSRSLLVTELLRRLGQERQAELAAEIDRDDQPAQVQVMLLEAVAGAGEFASMPAVADHITDEDARVRAAAVRALGRLAHPGVEPEIRRALDDSDEGVRRDAVIAAHRAGLHELAPLLGKRLEDPSWSVRHVAAQALAGLGLAGQSALLDAVERATRERRREIALAVEEAPAW